MQSYLQNYVENAPNPAAATVALREGADAAGVDAQAGAVHVGVVVQQARHGGVAGAVFVHGEAVVHGHRRAVRSRRGAGAGRVVGLIQVLLVAVDADIDRVRACDRDRARQRERDGHTGRQRADGLDLHEHFAGSGLRTFHLGGIEHVRGTVLVELHDAHARFGGLRRVGEEAQVRERDDHGLYREHPQDQATRTLAGKLLHVMAPQRRTGSGRWTRHDDVCSAQSGWYGQTTSPG